MFSWFKKISSNGPPKVTILSFIANNLLKVDIGGKIYEYYANPTIYKRVDFFVNKGLYGKALQILNKLEKFE